MFPSFRTIYTEKAIFTGKFDCETHVDTFFFLAMPWKYVNRVVRSEYVQLIFRGSSVRFSPCIVCHCKETNCINFNLSVHRAVIRCDVRASCTSHLQNSRGGMCILIAYSQELSSFAYLCSRKTAFISPESNTKACLIWYGGQIYVNSISERMFCPFRALQWEDSTSSSWKLYPTSDDSTI